MTTDGEKWAVDGVIKMKILSLFDGMACGMLAMQIGGVEVDQYASYEIDPYCKKTSAHNFPNIEQYGDVFQEDFNKYKGFDWLIGGSPCTYWSIAQTKNRETTASGLGWELFSQYVRALHEAEPKMFIYENNKSMSKAIRESITETFGFEPICINSALVSAQNRQRLYWCGIRQDDGTYKKADIEQPEDRYIMLKDILETNYSPLSENEMDYMVRDHQDQRWSFCNRPNQDEKSKCLVANVSKGVPYNVVAQPINITDEGKAQVLKANYYKSSIANFCNGDGGMKYAASGVAEPVCVAQRGRYPENPKSRVAGLPTEQMFEAREDYKTNTLTTVQKDNMVAEPIKIMNCGIESVNNVDCGIQAMLDMKGQEQIRRVYGQNGKAPTLTTCQGGHREPKVFEPIPECFRVKEATKQGYTDIKLGGCVDMSMPNSKTRRGRNMENKSNCLQTSCAFYQYCGTINTPIYEVKDGMITVKGKQYPIKLIDGYYIIRKLTVRECMRLQTIPEWYEFPVSNSQAYKMLGNGWTVEVIAHLIRSMMNQKE